MRVRGERGHALGLALIVLLLLSSGASLLALDLGTRLAADRAEARALHQRLLADAALARALAALDEDGSPSTFGPLDFAGGSIESVGETLAAGRWHIDARGTWGGATRTVRVDVVRSGSTVAVVRWERVPLGAQAR